MRIQTFSILTGSEACNARCPFCVSKMTPPLGVTLKEPEINDRNFEIACRFAKQCSVTTAMFTGKGEPLLFPGQITKYLEILRQMQSPFPFIEIQTNGIRIAEDPERFGRYLDDWYGLGLTTIAVSIVHYEPEANRQVYLPYKREYIDLPKLIAFLHEHEMSVRLSCTMFNGGIDSVEKFLELTEFARVNKVDQLSVRPVNKPDDSRNRAVYGWVSENYLRDYELEAIRAHVRMHGKLLMSLAHGATIYDLAGQNICLTDCLTIQGGGEDIRQLIFFPDGSLRYDWQYQGAVFIGGTKTDAEPDPVAVA